MIHDLSGRSHGASHSYRLVLTSTLVPSLSLFVDRELIWDPRFYITYFLSLEGLLMNIMQDSLMTPLVNDESTNGLVFDAYIRRPTVNSRAADSDRAEGMSDQDQQFGAVAATDNKTEIPQ